MKFHFAGLEIGSNSPFDIYKIKPKYILGSFYYLKKRNDIFLNEYFDYINSEYCKSFILDSGAFTYMFASEKQKKEIIENIDKYIKDYSDFIKKWKCQNYIEIDIDSIIGYDKVKKNTEKLENAVGYNSMPVFHNRYRNKNDLDNMLNKYDYICISNFNGKKTSTIFKNIKAIVKYAGISNVKVHGLALTGNKVTQEIPDFYSLDSTSWTSGIRFGQIPFFDTKFKKIINKSSLKKKVSGGKEGRKKIMFHAMTEWNKYANYLEQENGHRWR